MRASYFIFPLPATSLSHDPAGSSGGLRTHFAPPVALSVGSYPPTSFVYKVNDRVGATKRYSLLLIVVHHYVVVVSGIVSETALNWRMQEEDRQTVVLRYRTKSTRKKKTSPNDSSTKKRPPPFASQTAQRSQVYSYSH